MKTAREEPIIQSLLDTDFYKFTMGQFVFQKYRDVKVRFSFTNRTKVVALGQVIKEEELRRELDQVRGLRFNNSELHYLRGTNEYGDRMFREDYLYFLKDLEMPPYTLQWQDDSFTLEIEDIWPRAMHWETILVSIINELYYRALLNQLSRFDQDVVYAEGKLRLQRKIKTLREYPELTFSDFGTRRRFSREWQDYLVRAMAEEIPKQFRGTSNVLLAMKYGLLPMGTSAHELPMVAAALAMKKAKEGEEGKALVQAQADVLYGWRTLYGTGLAIALTDTFGSDFFFRNIPKKIAKDWKGTRQDSGDPSEYGHKNIAWLKRYGVDPRDKLLVFSDQLNPDLMIKLHKEFHGQIGDTYGWGTNLTNDLGFRTLSLVVKPSYANGHPTVKLSDNPAKAMGDPAEVERYKRAVQYVESEYVECVS